MSGTSVLLEGRYGFFLLLWLEYMGKKKEFHNFCEFIVVIRGLILTSSSSYALKVGFISPDLRHLDLNLSPLTFILGIRKRLVTLGLVHVVCFKLLKVPSHWVKGSTVIQNCSALDGDILIPAALLSQVGLLAPVLGHVRAEGWSSGHHMTKQILKTNWMKSSASLSQRSWLKGKFRHLSRQRGSFSVERHKWGSKQLQLFVAVPSYCWAHLGSVQGKPSEKSSMLSCCVVLLRACQKTHPLPCL